jgi:hypothetical protein
MKGLNKYSYTVDIVHRKNKNIKRLREMNRQYRIKPWKGLKEILMKKDELNFDDCDSVHSEDYKDFAEMIKQKRKLRKSIHLGEEPKEDVAAKKKEIKIEDEDRDNTPKRRSENGSGNKDKEQDHPE